MLLYEFEGKTLFKNCGINVPESQLIESEDSTHLEGVIAFFHLRGVTSLVFKAQVLSGKRADSGGIVRIKNQESRIKEELQKLFDAIIHGEKVERILAEEAIEIEKEYYLSFSYSTETRGPVMTFGKGGTGAEEKGAKSFPVDLTHLEGVSLDFARDKQARLRGVLPEGLIETTEKLWDVFTKYDCELAEINPLVIDKHKKAWALDSKIILDDDADFRRELKFAERNLFGRPPTEAEIEARKIDQGDHRGTAGSVYWDLDGDIATVAAGGGGSVVNMDALIAFGGKPANYTEHSGNPPREKLKKLTKIVLSKPNLKGCWFVGGTANFTDIYETLMGFVEGLREVKPKVTYPIVIRRGGPQDKEAFEMLKKVGREEGYDFHIYGRETPMTATAKTMVDLAYGKENVESRIHNSEL